MKTEIAKKRILVVDDNKDLANVTVRLLSILEHEARAAYDGLTALDEIEAYEPDMVFLDIGMPGLDGCEVAARIRERYPEKDIVLVAITGYSQPEYNTRIKQNGFDCHLVKPVAMTEFKRVADGDYINMSSNQLAD